MEPSSWVGRDYLAALTGARAQGEAPQRIQVTRPPYPCAGEGGLRVVGERELDSVREWILAYERYQRLKR